MDRNYHRYKRVAQPDPGVTDLVWANWSRAVDAMFGTGIEPARHINASTPPLLATQTAIVTDITGGGDLAGIMYTLPLANGAF